MPIFSSVINRLARNAISPFERFGSRFVNNGAASIARTVANFKAGGMGAATRTAGTAATSAPVTQSIAKTGLRNRVSFGGIGRGMYKAGVGVYKGWNSMPPSARRAIVGTAIGAGMAISAGRGAMRGWKEGFMSPEDMYNKAHGYQSLGEEQYFRNQGRLPSNHLGHAGIGLSMSRMRHG